MICITQYFIRIGDATSQLFNVVFFLGDPNESISGRSYRLQEKIQWGLFRKFIDWLISPFEEQHCKKAYQADIDRAKRIVNSL